MSLVVVAVMFALLIQPPAARPYAAANARVAGRVVDAASNAPVSEALVMLLPIEQPFPPGAMGPPQTITDAKGEFVLDRVWTGRFRVQIRKTGFAPLGDLSDRQTVEVAAGQSIAGLTFSLARGGAIAGRVLDAGGEPAADLVVQAIRQDAERAAPFFGGSGNAPAQTNDLGEFRLAGLRAGRYIVVASPRPQPPFAQASSAATTLQAPTYYPGTSDRRAAHFIDVAAAQTVGDIQFSIVTVAAHQVSGVVVDEADSPQAGAVVTLMGEPRPDGMLIPATGRTDETGTFHIAGVASGTYRVMATIPVTWTASSGIGGDRGIVAGGVGAGAVGAVGGAAVATPTGGITWSSGPVAIPGSPQVEVTVDNADVNGLRLVVAARRP